MKFVVFLAVAAIEAASAASNGYHTVTETQRGWAFKAPDGRLWRSRAVEKANGLGPDCGALGKPYASALSRQGLSREKWCEETSLRLRSWGFNTLGTACDPKINSRREFAMTEMIALSSWMRDLGEDHLIKVDPSSPCTPLANVFHPDFPSVCERAAKASCTAARRDDPDFLGYYLDNELNWWGRGNWWECGLLDSAIEHLPPEHAARKAAERILAKVPSARVPDRAAARRLYTQHVARRYFSTIVSAIRRHDPNHLILGCRFAGVAGAPDIVWKICGEYCDVVSLNCYPNADISAGTLSLGVAAPILPKGFTRTGKWTSVPLATMLRGRYEVAGKPLFIGEWSFRGGDIGSPRAESNGQQLSDQRQRSQAVSLFLNEMERLSFVVGHAFYMWTDERFACAGGAETLNWGLVSLENKPHPEVAAAFRAARSAFGFHRVEKTEGGWTLVDAADRPWKILAIEKANMTGPRCEARGERPYHEHLKAAGDTRQTWVDRTARRLRDWGFNTLGSGCDHWLARHGFAHTEMLAFGARLTKADGDPTHYIRPWKGRCCEQFPNVFHPEFARVCDEVARLASDRLRNDPAFIGYYLDNELNWWGDGDWYYCGMMDYVLKNLPNGHSAREEAMRIAREHGYATAQSYLAAPEKVRDPIRRAYTRLVAETYFRVTTEAIRRHDPNHLILGCRFAGVQGAPDEVWETAGRYCDVVSLNCYPSADLAKGILTVSLHHRPLGARNGKFAAHDAAGVFARLAALTRRPLFITEWSFIGLDAGLPCRRGCGQRLPTQADRARAVSLFLENVNGSENFIGSEYFMWTDDPPEGVTRVDPEDCNYGLVDLKDEPYHLVTGAFRRAKEKWEGEK